MAAGAARQLGMKQRDLRYIKNAFELIDSDSSGEISYTEFWEFMRDPLSTNQEGALRTVYSDALFALIDEDGSGLSAAASVLSPPTNECERSMTTCEIQAMCKHARACSLFET